MSLAENPNLEGLYPFLHGRKQDPASMNSALLESVKQKAAHHHEVIDAFFARNGQEVVATAGAIADVYRRNGRLFSMGNGGVSSNSAPHEVDMLLSQTDFQSDLTAINPPSCPDRTEAVA